MTKYWANAIVMDEVKKKPARLFTYSPATTIDECDTIFIKWATQFPYKLLITWIDAEYDGGSKKIIHKKEYI